MNSFYTSTDPSSYFMQGESSEFSTISDWNGQYHRRQPQPQEEPMNNGGNSISLFHGVDEAIRRLQIFYKLQNGICTNSHEVFYQAFQNAFDKHATALVHPFGTSVTDMTNPKMRQEFTNADDLYFDVYRPYATLNHPMRILNTTNITAENEKQQQQQDTTKNKPSSDETNEGDKNNNNEEATTTTTTTTTLSDNDKAIQEEDEEEKDMVSSLPSTTRPLYGEFKFIAQEQYAGRTLTILYRCHVQHGRIIHFEQQGTTVSIPQTSMRLMMMMTPTNNDDGAPGPAAAAGGGGTIIQQQQTNVRARVGHDIVPITTARIRPIRKLWARMQRFGQGGKISS